MYNDDFRVFVKVFDFLDESLFFLGELVDDDEDDVAFGEDELLDHMLCEESVFEFDFVDLAFFLVGLLVLEFFEVGLEFPEVLVDDFILPLVLDGCFGAGSVEEDDSVFVFQVLRVECGEADSGDRVAEGEALTGELGGEECFPLVIEAVKGDYNSITL